MSLGKYEACCGHRSVPKDNGRGIMSFGLAWNTRQIPEKPYWERKGGEGANKIPIKQKWDIRFTVFSRIKLVRRLFFPSKIFILNHWNLLLSFLWDEVFLMWLRLSLNMTVPMQLPEWSNICVLLCLALTGSFSYLWVSGNFSGKSLETSNFQTKPAKRLLKQHALS